MGWFFFFPSFFSLAELQLVYISPSQLRQLTNFKENNFRRALHISLKKRYYSLDKNKAKSTGIRAQKCF